VKNYQVHPTHWLISTQVLVPVGAGARTGHGLAHPEEAVHAAARRGRGEAAAAEPPGVAFLLGIAFRRRVGERAATAVFVVTLGNVSSTYRGISLALGLRRRPRVQLLASAEHVCRDCLAARGSYTRLKIGAESRRCKPEAETNEW